MMLKLLLVCAIFAVNGSTAQARADVGRVIDAADRAPVSDVYIATAWHGQVYMVVQSGHSCFHLDVVQSDGGGWYERPTSPAAAANIYEIRSRVVAYRKGYKVVEPPSGREIQMERDISPSSERMRYVIGLAEDMQCGSQEEQQVLIPVFKQIYEEMNTIASRSMTELKMLNGMQYMIDMLEVAPEVARKRWNQRKEAWGIQ
jgi:hypothetical protein